ncbi:8-oxo-dGTP diphosphatase [Pseudalkalibacillus sp. Hm43]|uniref:8-oxo-dGTP diphosphatase n=1 Tax=Pseudalkalibacillus sp. Hm43 TaxID=3450742 RepID=UPI003F42BD9C
MTVNYKIWTFCMIQDGDKILLIDRQKEVFKGFIPPGGSVEFPESIMDCAIREVKEETGLTVRNLEFKGLNEYVNPTTNARYMIFNYLTKDFEGELLENPPEGKLYWVPIDEALQLPMQKSFKRRFPLFFEDGTFEIHVVWDNVQNEEEEVTINRT